ncbi:uncharacterized protein KD926_011621 [Aspergillus affinis]|uniref:uncharacterized protein n=1 Tax=Aspergillus affinis TaxID=1070780 RepID=UPI0022FDC775|nr:uncharacterized protein KD926_011621 [Aspergillus affinis]KAI9044651.1 hypothetical protein KD926_011621 [Aspergillus affinis]
MSDKPNDLPICSVVGVTVNLLSANTDPFDVGVTLDRSKKYPLVAADQEEGTSFQPPGSDDTYWLPSNFRKTDIGAQNVEGDLFVATGSELASDLEMNPSLSISHAGVSVEDSEGFRYSTSLKNNSLYGIYSFDQKVYSVGLKPSNDVYNFVSEEYVSAANALPDWVEEISKESDETSLAEASDVVKKYQSFFNRCGSHVVEECHLGSRYQLLVESPETGIEKKEDFLRLVKKEYSGIFNTAADPNIASSSEFNEYLRKRRSQCKIIGGDIGAANALAHNPTDSDKFQEWMSTRSADPPHALVHIKTTSVGSFLERSENEEHQEAAAKLKPAMEYLSGLHTLKGTLSTLFLASSGWIELSVTPLPGVTVRVVDKPIVVITQVSPTSVKVQPVVKESYIEVGVIITAPDEQVDVSFSTSATGSFGALSTLSLTPYGPEKYRTAIRGVATSDEAFSVLVPSLISTGRFGGTGTLKGTLEVEAREYASFHMALQKQATGVSMKMLATVERKDAE